jgi:hypothetical protein
MKGRLYNIQQEQRLHERFPRAYLRAPEYNAVV